MVSSVTEKIRNRSPEDSLFALLTTHFPLDPRRLTVLAALILAIVEKRTVRLFQLVVCGSPDAQTLPNLFLAQKTAPFMPDELSVGDQHRPTFRGQHLEQAGHQENAGHGATVPLVRENSPHE